MVTDGAYIHKYIRSDISSALRIFDECPLLVLLRVLELEADRDATDALLAFPGVTGKSVKPNNPPSAVLGFMDRFACARDISGGPHVFCVADSLDARL